MKKFIITYLIVIIATYLLLAFVCWDITIITELPALRARKRAVIAFDMVVIAYWFTLYYQIQKTKNNGIFLMSAKLLFSPKC